MIKHVLSKLFATAYWPLYATLMCLSLSSHGAYVDKELSAGKVRIHIPEVSNAQCSAVLIGVGTAMRADSYDKLSKQIIKYGHVVVILDHAPGDTFKTDANKYTSLAQAVKHQLLSWIPNSSCNGISNWIMGGHSAGGQAAQNAVANNPGLAHGIFSIDPYNAKDTQPVYVPALYWGFDKTTCFVEIDDAAKGTYYRSQDKRAFVKVGTKYSWGPCGYSPKYFHCSFCDGHCPACTNCKTTPKHFFKDVAASLNNFINAAFTGSWNKSALMFESTTPYTLYEGSDQP